MIERLHDFLTSMRLAVTAALGTAASGLGQWIDMVPSNTLSKGATIIGIILSSVLIYVHIRRDRREAIKLQVELEILRQKQKDEGAD